MADIVELAVGAGCFQTLVAAVQAAGLVEALKSPGPFTVFAPNDDAFAALPPGTVTTLVQNPPQLARILKYHVVAGRYTKADLHDGLRLQSLEGSLIPIFLQGQEFEVKNATVLTADILADNGVIHVLNRVILMGGDGPAPGDVTKGWYSQPVTGL
ncbi:fasciclin domain-containing protein [Gloeomargarita sp.]